MQLSKNIKLNMRIATVLILSLFTICFFCSSSVSASSSFGNTAGGDTVQYNLWDHIRGDAFTFLGGDNQKIDSITARLSGSHSVNYEVWCAIYFSANKSLLGTTDKQIISMTTAINWYTFNFSSQIALANNTEYALIVMANTSDSKYVWFWATAANSFWNMDTGYNGTNFPATFSGTYNTNHIFKIYANYSTIESSNFTLTVNEPTNGAINETGGSYNNGTVLGLLATPDPTYHFLNWIIDGSNSTSNPESVTMTENHTISAYFELNTWYLDVGAEFHGTMNTTSGWYGNGAIVNILATPSDHYSFLNWIIDAANETDNPLEITMDQNHTVDAYFEVSEYYLTISNLSHGSLNTTSGYYPVDEIVFIEGYGAEHYVLEYFNVDGTNQSWLDWDINVTMDSDHTVGAYFTIIIRGFTVYDPVGGTTNATNSSYDDGTTIYIEATPNANYTFSHWFTDYYPNSTDNPYELLIESNIDLYAYFDPYPVLENTLEITPNNTTLYTNETLEFSAQLLFVNGSPIADQGLIILLNETVIYLDQTDALGWVNGSYNITALEGNYTLAAKFNEIVDDIDHYILSGNSTDPQLLTFLDPPAAPAPPPAHYTSDSSTPGGVLVFSVIVLIIMMMWSKNGGKSIKIKS